MTDLRLVGRKLRDAGRDKVAARNREWLEWIRKEARMYCLWHNNRVTVDDLRMIVSDSVREPTHHNVYGAIFNEKGWVRIGYEQSRRPKAHARPIGIWAWEGK
jgi:hypothetical protein